MAKIKEYNGNEYVDITFNENQIDRNDMRNLLNFINTHKKVFLYGNGVCGKGMREYFSVCRFENIFENITSETFEGQLKDYKKGEIGIILALKSDYYPEILPKILKKVDIDDVLFLKERTKQIFGCAFSEEYLDKHMWLTLPLTLHCNVNCASCNMYAPLCAPELYTLEEVKKDLQRIKETQLNLVRINITGGEPFLNPETTEIIEYIQEEFAGLKVDIYTNGLLLHKLSDSQLEKLSKGNFVFYITEYGIHSEELEQIYQKFNKFNISYVVNYMDEKKLFYKKKIDFNKTVLNYEYINCQYYTMCFALFMFKGLLYKCPLAMNADKINKAFDKNIEVTKKDYLNLDEVESAMQLHEFWRSRLPMCSYCPPVTDAVPWKRSERKIEEWT